MQNQNHISIPDTKILLALAGAEAEANYGRESIIRIAAERLNCMVIADIISLDEAAEILRHVIALDLPLERIIQALEHLASSLDLLQEASLISLERLRRISKSFPNHTSALGLALLAFEITDIDQIDFAMHCLRLIERGRLSRPRAVHALKRQFLRGEVYDFSASTESRLLYFPQAKRGS